MSTIHGSPIDLAYRFTAHQQPEPRHRFSRPCLTCKEETVDRPAVYVETHSLVAGQKLGRTYFFHEACLPQQIIGRVDELLRARGGGPA